MAKAAGAQFEASVQDSCVHHSIFVYRVRDVFVPPELRSRIEIPEIPYDYIIANGIIIPAELKSTQEKSLSFKMIRKNQIDGLGRAQQYLNTFPGFIFNFRDYNNRTYYVHIKDFLYYQRVVAGEAANPYRWKVNAASMPLEICADIGVPVDNKLLKVHYRYDIPKLINDVKEKYSKGE